MSRWRPPSILLCCKMNATFKSLTGTETHMKATCSLLIRLLDFILWDNQKFWTMTHMNSGHCHLRNARLDWNNQSSRWLSVVVYRREYWAIHLKDIEGEDTGKLAYWAYLWWSCNIIWSCTRRTHGSNLGAFSVVFLGSLVAVFSKQDSLSCLLCKHSQMREAAPCP